MTLQYFVTASDTGNRIPIEVDKSTPADLAATKESWQTDWTSEFIRLSFKSDDAVFTRINGKLDAERDHHTPDAQIFFLNGQRRVALRVAFDVLNINEHAGFCFAVSTQCYDFAVFGFSRVLFQCGVTFEAKTDELAKHYIRDFGAIRVFAKQSGGPIMLMLADNAALLLFNTYLS